MSYTHKSTITLRKAVANGGTFEISYPIEKDVGLSYAPVARVLIGTTLYGFPITDNGSGFTATNTSGSTLAFRTTLQFQLFPGESEVRAEWLGASPTSSAAVNTAAIQAALAAGGTVTLTTPGVYNVDPISGTFNAEFKVGPGISFRPSLSKAVVACIKARRYPDGHPNTQVNVAEGRLFEEINETVTIPTSVVADDQITSPSVVYSQEKWNGYHYWMIVTPYNGTNPDDENPEIFCSNDGLTWAVPTGTSNPLVASPAGTDYNSDAFITFSPDGNELLVLYRSFVNPAENLWLIRSTDGVTWTTPILLKTWNSTSVRFQSPSLIWDHENDRWVVFLVEYIGSPSALKYMTCSTLTGTWGELQSCTYTLPTGVTALWQGYVVRASDGTLWCLMQSGDSGGGKYYLMRSRDGVTWTFSSSLWPKRTVYAGCLVPRSGYFECYLGYLSPSWYTERSRIVFDRATYFASRNAFVTNGVAVASAPVGRYLVVDTFNRADGAVGTATSGQVWTVETGTINVSSNKVAGATSGKIYIDSGAADVEISVDWSTPYTSGQAWVILRRTDNNNFWRIGTLSGQPTVQKIVSGGVDTAWAFAGHTEAAGDQLRIVAIGNSIRAYWNDKCWADIRDATGVSNTQHGFQITNSTHRLDNFIVARAG
jgi:hypothetical protein